jgi:hypothetical protein
MAKLQDMFTQARRAQSSGNIGFLGKARAEIKPRAAALVVELHQLTGGSAEAAIKAGADGLIFLWNGKDSTTLATIKSEIESVATGNAQVVSGLHITGGWDKIDRDSLTQFKDAGIQYITLPLDAPARLLALESKELEFAVTIPMRSGDMYPLFIRNVTAFDNVAAVVLDFNLASDVSTLTIEDILQYRAVREAVRFPALLKVKNQLTEAEGYTLLTLGVQAFVLSVSSVNEAAKQQIKALRELLEKMHQEDKETLASRK